MVSLKLLWDFSGLSAAPLSPPKASSSPPKPREGLQPRSLKLHIVDHLTMHGKSGTAHLAELEKEAEDLAIEVAEAESQVALESQALKAYIDKERGLALAEERDGVAGHGSAMG